MFRLLRLLGILVIFCAGCSQQSKTAVSITSSITPVSDTLVLTNSLTSVVSTSTSEPTATLVPPTTPSKVDLSTPTLLPTTTPTVVQAPIAATWTGFTYNIANEAFLYLEYPTDWQVTVYSTMPAASQPPSQPVFPAIKFFYPTGEKFSIRVDNYAVNLNVYHRPPQEKDIANPHTWDASKIDYQILWEKPLSTQEANGLIFVWGPDLSLNGIYYNEKYQVDVRFATNIDNDSLLIAETQGFTQTIAQRFQVFEHMVNSVRIITPE